MSKAKSIKKNRVLPPSMDYALLKREGIDHAQQLSGDIWSDYNEHDPGVTILENICYALTELGYKTNFDIEDLLYAKGKEGDRPVNNLLYNIAEIFPCAPLTKLDYRKIIIDRVQGINNAWVLPLQQSGLGINIDGLYEVLLQVDDIGQKEIIEKEVSDILNEHRNLGEDFDIVRVLDSEKIRVHAGISIESNKVGESILAQILFELSHWLSPQLSFFNLEEMLEKRYTYEEIFNGPPPYNGFIDTKDLERSDIHHINTIYKSRLIRIISDIDGVIEVTNFSLFINGVKVEKELIELEKYTYPVLDIENMLVGEGTIQFFAGDILYGVDRATTRYAYDMLQAKSRRSHRRWLDLTVADGSSERKNSEIEYFYSVQNTFPRIYGIGEFGIEGRATNDRKGQSNQLKAYLLFFEQLMINYLAQLTNIRKLFSVEDDVKQTYFYNLPDSIPDAADLLSGGRKKFEAALEKLVQKYDRRIERRNRFLDHLLARFGEEFMEDAYDAIHREANFYTKEDFGQKTIKTKLKFLRNLIDISRNRAKGTNYSADPNNPENVTGLKKKICLLFNIENYGHRMLAGVNRDKSIKVTKNKKTDVANDKAGEFNFRSNKKDVFSQILAHGISRNNYIIVQEKSNFNVKFIHPITNEKSQVFQAKKLQDCEDALIRLIQKLRDLNAEADGFHVIEHILLRPIQVDYRLFLASPVSRLLQSPQLVSDPEVGKINFAKALLKNGLARKNYSVIDSGDDHFVLELRDDKKELIGFNNRFFLKKSAIEAIGDIIQLINQFIKKSKAFSEEIEADLVSKKGAAFLQDPYSQKISFVLPAWAGRFQSKKMKLLFENVVRVNSPAHLSVHFHWLSITEMAKFENIYNKWINSKFQNQLGNELDDLSLQILDSLMENLN